MTVIDIHAHFVPAELFERLARPGAAPPGVELAVQPDGTQMLKIGTAPPTPVPPGITDLAERRQAMARQGVDWQWLTPWLSTVGYSLGAELGAAWSRMVNESLVRAVPKGSPFLAGATVPLQDGKAAAEELDHALTLGMTGLIIGTHANGKSLDDPDLEPLWQVAAGARAPIMIHPFGLAPGARLDRYHLKNLVGNPADTTIAAAQLIFGGVIDRHPDLKVLLVHGGGFFPYQFGRWDHGFEVRTDTKVHLGRPPSDYLKWFFYDTVTHSHQALSYLSSLVGPDRIGLGTDYPFDMADFDPRRTVSQAELGQEATAAIESETPRRFLGRTP